MIISESILKVKDSVLKVKVLKESVLSLSLGCGWGQHRPQYNNDTKDVRTTKQK